MMGEFSIKTIGVALSFCIFVTISLGQEGCNCRCPVPHYGELNVCAWLKDASPKVDSSRNEIEYLEKKITKLMRFKDQFEKKLTDEVLAFIETNFQQSTVQHAPEKLQIKTNEPAVDLVAEMERLKKKFEDERDELEAKIEQIEKNCLRRTDHLSEKVDAIESRVVQAESSVLQRINKTEEQALKLEEKILVRVTKNEDQTLKFKGEILEKVDETGNKILNLSNYLHSKINDVGTETLKLKDEFLVQANEQRNRTASAEREILAKINDLEKETSKMEDEFLQKATELENQSSNAKDELLRRMDETANSRDVELKEEFLKRVNEVEERSSKQRKELKTEVQQVENLLRNETKEQRDKWIHFEESLNNAQLKIELIKPEVQMEINSSTQSLAGYVKRHFREIYQKLHGLEKQKYRDLNGRLVTVEEKMANVGTTLSKDQIEQLFSLTFDAYKSNISSTILELQARTGEIEKSLEKLNTKEISSNDTEVRSNMTEAWNSITKLESRYYELWNYIAEIHSDTTQLWNNIREIHNNSAQLWNNIAEIHNDTAQLWNNTAEIHNDTAQLWNNIAEIHNDTAKLWNDISEIHNGTTEMWNNITVIWSAIEANQTLSSFAEQKKCGNVVISRQPIAHNGSILSAIFERQAEKTILQVLRVVQKKASVNAGYYNDSCNGVVISNHWLVISPRCIQEHSAIYQYAAWFTLFDPQYTEVKPFLYSDSENRLSSRSSRSDIGLLLSQKAIDDQLFYDDRNFTVACLPPYKMRDKVFGSAVFVGWDSFRFFELHLYQVNIISDEECQKSHLAFDSSMICTQYDPFVLKACEEIKGGLLFKSIHKKTVLIGIADNCGSPDKPVVYSEVAHFANWVDSFTDRVQNGN